MNGCIQTRFFAQDYSPHLDSSSSFEKSRKKLQEFGLNRACDDTRPGLVLWRWNAERFLKVTGIPSHRKDKVKTPIRYTLIIQGEMGELEKWFAFFLAVFSGEDRSTLENLAQTLDSFIDDENTSFKEGTTFQKVLAALLPIRDGVNATYKGKGLPDSGYDIFSPLLPDASYVSEVVLPGTPQGTLWLGTDKFERIEVSHSSKKKPNLPEYLTICAQQPAMLAVFCIILVAFGLTVWGLVALVPTSEKKATPAVTEENKSAQAPKAPKAPTMNQEQINQQLQPQPEAVNRPAPPPDVEAKTDQAKPKLETPKQESEVPETKASPTPSPAPVLPAPVIAPTPTSSQEQISNDKATTQAKTEQNKKPKNGKEKPEKTKKKQATQKGTPPKEKKQ